MKERKLVVISGLIGSGKSELTSQLVDRYGFDRRCIGDHLAELIRRRDGLSPDAPVPALGRMALHKSIRQTDPNYFAKFLTETPYARRVADGVRNYRDVLHCIKHGATVVTLVAPESVRIERALARETVKDANIEEILRREAQDMDDPDPDGGHVRRVMELAHDYGFFVDATQSKEAVLEEVVRNLGV